MIHLGTDWLVTTNWIKSQVGNDEALQVRKAFLVGMKEIQVVQFRHYLDMLLGIAGVMEKCSHWNLLIKLETKSRRFWDLGSCETKLVYQRSKFGSLESRRQTFYFGEVEEYRNHFKHLFENFGSGIFWVASGWLIKFERWLWNFGLDLITRMWPMRFCNDGCGGVVEEDGDNTKWYLEISALNAEI